MQTWLRISSRLVISPWKLRVWYLVGGIVSSAFSFTDQVPWLSVRRHTLQFSHPAVLPALSAFQACLNETMLAMPHQLDCCICLFLFLLLLLLPLGQRIPNGGWTVSKFESKKKLLPQLQSWLFSEFFVLLQLFFFFTCLIRLEPEADHSIWSQFWKVDFGLLVWGHILVILWSQNRLSPVPQEESALCLLLQWSFYEVVLYKRCQLFFPQYSDHKYCLLFLCFLKIPSH